MSVKAMASGFALDKAMNYISGDPGTNLVKLYDLITKMGWDASFKEHRDYFRGVLCDPENTWNKFLVSLWSDIDIDVLKTTFKNFGLNASYLQFQKGRKNEEKYGCNIPWAMLIDPTSACNLDCTGCWAAEYGDKLNMSYETLDSIITQGKELGTYFYIFSGGEPLVRKDDIIRLCEAHSDCQFMAFTNGTLINESFADEILRVKNFMPAISIEGFAYDTDARRGSGTFEKVEKAMAILRKKRLGFGLSCTYTSQNVDVLSSEAYIDQMIAWGAKFCWYFTYMPVGKSAVPELMVTAEQRELMYSRIRAFRKDKPIFMMDFWNDGEYAKGCVAGGRRYLHINANGDIEPCAFIHYSDSNIHKKTILEALQSPLFMAYREHQPFNENHLRPCPLLDNPKMLDEMIKKSGAYSTDLQNPENVGDLCAKCKDAAGNWAPVADKLWSCSGKCAGTSADGKASGVLVETAEKTAKSA